MYVVCGSRLPASSTSNNNNAQQPTSKKKRHHSTSGAGGDGGTNGSAGQAMPFAATVKAQMLRLLRRTKSTRSAIVIPNKRYSVLVPESPSVIVEPLPPSMALGTTTPVSAGVAVPPEIRRLRHRSHSQVRRHSRQVSGPLPQQRNSLSVSVCVCSLLSSVSLFFYLFLTNCHS